MMLYAKKIAVLCSVSACLLLYACGEKSNPVSAPVGPVVNLTAKSKLQGEWQAEDPISDKWKYVFKGNTLKILKVVGSDSTLTYSGLFTMDSSAIPNKMDIQLTTPDYASFTGKTIKTLYNYMGAMGSFIRCNILKNDPDVARPVDMSDPTGDKSLSLFFIFGTGN